MIDASFLVIRIIILTGMTRMIRMMIRKKKFLKLLLNIIIKYAILSIGFRKALLTYTHIHTKHAEKRSGEPLTRRERFFASGIVRSNEN